MKVGYKILIATLLIGVITGVAISVISVNNKTALKKHVISEYNFEISYPDAYVDNSKSQEKESNILSNITVKESGEKISEYMQSLNFVEVVKDLKNKVNGIRLIVEAIKTEKTTLDLEEICKRYVVMFKIYNEDVVIKNTNKEIVNIDGREAGRVVINVKGENQDSEVIAYLISLEDREITITFIAPEQTILNHEEQINKIVNSIKLY